MGDGKMKPLIYFISMTLVVLFIGCDTTTDPQWPVIFERTFDFSEHTDGWIAGFADYPIGEEEFYELMSDRTPLPEPLDSTQFSIMISGNNHSDDLFMFLKRRFIGLGSNRLYDIVFEVEMASQYPQNAVGVGGGPGSSVYFKVGGFPTEPLTEVIDGYHRMTIDKGNQAAGGEDMVTLGTIGISGDDFVYTLIRGDSENFPVRVRSTQDGDLWLIVGTDSGFESTTTLYYNEIVVKLTEVN